MIQTLSNLTIIIYAIAVMTMLLDTTPARLSRNKLSLLWAGAGIIALLQFFAGCVLGIKIYLRFYFFFAQLPVFLPVSYTHLDVYKRQIQGFHAKSCHTGCTLSVHLGRCKYIRNCHFFLDHALVYRYAISQKDHTLRLLI